MNDDKNMLAMFNTLNDTHTESLQLKGFQDQNKLLEAIRVDRTKVIWAMTHLCHQSPQELLHAFFGHAPQALQKTKTLFNYDRLYHIGFELMEPMDVALQNLQRILHGIHALHGFSIEVLKEVRFPASDAFQKRVGAYTEIMRISLQVNGVTTMLELFDIQKPQHVPSVGAHFNISDLLEKKPLPYPRRAFSNDRTWHYALLIDQPGNIHELHEYFKSFVQANPGYILPFENIVNNKHDGSFYTKIIHATQKTELEFVAEGQFGAEKDTAPDQQIHSAK